jgi:peptidoglycan hydrolase-like protein with peptidoglycan-binding domain
MTTLTRPGAGAWVRPRWYDVTTCGASVHGIDDSDAQRIRYAAGAVQRELVQLGYLSPNARCDGHYGPLTDAAIKSFQADHGLAADGGAGPKTLLEMVVPLTDAYEHFGIPDHLLRGMIRLESGCDPGAEGVIRTYGTDMGLAQINDEANPTIPRSLAYGDMRFSVNFAAGRLFTAKRRQSDDQTYAQQHRWDCAVLDHNSPANADHLYDTGEYPNDDAAKYVRLVREYGAKAVAA